MYPFDSQLLLKFYEFSISKAFQQKFREINWSNTKSLLLHNCKFTFHNNVEKWKICSHRKNISSNQLFGDFFSKNVAFTKFLPKKCEREYPQCSVEKTRNCLSHFFDKNFVKVTVLLKKLWNSWFDEIFSDNSKFFIFLTVMWVR